MSLRVLTLESKPLDEVDYDHWNHSVNRVSPSCEPLPQNLSPKEVHTIEANPYFNSIQEIMDVKEKLMKEAKTLMVEWG